MVRELSLVYCLRHHTRFSARHEGPSFHAGANRALRRCWCIRARFGLPLCGGIGNSGSLWSATGWSRVATHLKSRWYSTNDVRGLGVRKDENRVPWLDPGSLEVSVKSDAGVDLVAGAADLGWGAGSAIELVAARVDQDAAIEPGLLTEIIRGDACADMRLDCTALAGRGIEAIAIGTALTGFEAGILTEDASVGAAAAVVLSRSAADARRIAGAAVLLDSAAVYENPTFEIQIRTRILGNAGAFVRCFDAALIAGRAVRIGAALPEFETVAVALDMVGWADAGVDSVARAASERRRAGAAVELVAARVDQDAAIEPCLLAKVVGRNARADVGFDRSAFAGGGREAVAVGAALSGFQTGALAEDAAIRASAAVFLTGRTANAGFGAGATVVDVAALVFEGAALQFERFTIVLRNAGADVGCFDAAFPA